MPAVTPKKFKEIVAFICTLDGRKAEMEESKVYRDGHYYTHLQVAFYDAKEIVVRVEFLEGEATVKVLKRPLLQPQTQVWGVRDLFALSVAIGLAAEVLDHVEKEKTNAL